MNEKSLKLSILLLFLKFKDWMTFIKSREWVMSNGIVSGNIREYKAMIVGPLISRGVCLVTSSLETQ